MTVSVIVCAYADERYELLAAALRSLRAQVRHADEIVLVIDGNPGLLARIEREHPDVTAIANAGKRGLSGARNTGVARARGEIVAFLDDDAEAAPDWLERLVRHYEDEGVAGVGGHIEPAWATGRPAWFPEEFLWVVGCSYRGLPESCAPVRNLIGANMSFRRDLLVAAGGFHTGLGRVGKRPLGCEETELCIRLGEEHVLLHDPEARVSHHVPAERATWSYFSSRCYAEGLSKAFVAELAGAGRLSSERRHALRTIPRGIARGLGAGAVRKAFAIGAGLAITTSGYLVGRRREVTA